MNRKIPIYLLLLLLLLPLIPSITASAKDTYEVSLTYTGSFPKSTYREGVKLCLWIPPTRIYKFGFAKNQPYQTVEVISTTDVNSGKNINPDQVLRTPEGNTLLVFETGKLQPEDTGGTYSYHLTITLKITLTYFKETISQSNSGTLNDIPQELKLKYCIPEKYWETQNQELINLANSLTDSNNVYVIVKSIYDYVTGLTYDLSVLTTGRSAYKCYQTGKGVCQDFSDLMVTLCRIRGVPARLVVGAAYLSGMRDLEEGLHAWVEAYIPPWGWIVMDPTNWFLERGGYFGLLSERLPLISWIVVEHGLIGYDPGDMRGRLPMFGFFAPGFDQGSVRLDGTIHPTSGEAVNNLNPKTGTNSIVDFLTLYLHYRDIEAVYGNEVDRSMCYKYYKFITERSVDVNSQRKFQEAIILGGEIANPEMKPLNDDMRMKRVYEFSYTYTPVTTLWYYIYSKRLNLTVTGEDYGVRDYGVIFTARKFETVGGVSLYRDVLAVQGLTMYGTWACWVFLQEYVYTDISHASDFIVILWEDANGNGVVEYEEIEVVAKG